MDGGRGTRRILNIAIEAGGSHDGIGAADHDLPYHFDRRPSARWTYPFTAEQYCRLLILRGRVRDGEFAGDRAKARARAGALAH